jgi:hypothetical protein
MILPLVSTVSSPIVRFRWRAFWAILGITFAVVAGFWFVVPPTYLTNDDVQIKRDLEGLSAPGALPTGYVLMAHSILGWALVAIQPLIPVHGWDLMVAGLLIASAAMLLAVVWALSEQSSDCLLLASVALITLTPLFAAMQFTISATLAGVAAMTAAATELLLPVPRRSVLAASGALLLLGLLVRPMGASAGALLTAALLVPLTVSNNELSRLRMRRLGLSVATIGVSAVALVYVDEALYRLSPMWDAYHQDNWMLAWFFEWGGDLPERAVAPLRSQLGWSSAEWELLRRFWGIDPAIYSHGRIETLYAAWSALVDWHLRASWLAQRAAAELNVNTVLRLLAESKMTVVSSAIVVLAWGTRRALAVAVTSAAIFYAACIVIEVIFKELPARLFAPLQVGLLAAVVVTCRTLTRQPRRLVTTLCTALAIGVVIYQARTVTSQAFAENQQSRETDAQVLDLLRQRPSLLLLHADSFPSEYWWRPFHTPPAVLPAIQLGLNNHNPYVQRFVAHSHPESLLQRICSDSSVIVVAERGRLDAVTTFMKERYATDVQWNEVYSGSFRAWRCIRVYGG